MKRSGSQKRVVERVFAFWLSRKAAATIVLYTALTQCSFGFDEGNLNRDAGLVDTTIASDSTAEASSTPSDALIDTEVSPPVQKTQTIKIAADADDGEVNSNTLFPQGEVFPNAPFQNRILPGVWDDMVVWGYFRFKLSESIAANATINSASMRGYSAGTDGTWSSTEHWLVVGVEDSVAPPEVTGTSDRPNATGGRALLANISVSWNENEQLPWPIAPSQSWQTSPDISALIQGLVNKNGELPANSYIQLWIRGGMPINQRAQAGIMDYSGGSSTAAELSIDWTE